jgi:hypothetical protein
MMEGSSRGQEFEVLVDVNLGFLYFHTVE